jgi:hypothetical protein
MRIILSEGKVTIFNLVKNAGTSVDRIERFLRAQFAAVARNGNQPANVWRQRRKLVRCPFAYVAQFDMAIRKLLPELQSGSQRLHENPIFRFRYSVDFDDVTCVRRVIGEFVLHENLTVRPDSRLIETIRSGPVAIV